MFQGHLIRTLRAPFPREQTALDEETRTAARYYFFNRFSACVCQIQRMLQISNMCVSDTYIVRTRTLQQCLHVCFKLIRSGLCARPSLANRSLSTKRPGLLRVPTSSPATRCPYCPRSWRRAKDQHRKTPPVTHRLAGPSRRWRQGLRTRKG